MKLILKLLAGIIVGIIVGLLGVDWITRIFLTVEVILGQFIRFMIPLIILFFIASGVTKLGNGSGKMVGLTVGTAYVSTLLAGTLAFFVASFVMPYVAKDGGVPEEGASLASFIDFEIAPIMGVVTALVLAFAFGISMTMLKSDTLIRFFDEGKAVVELIIVKAIIPLLPFYIAGIFAGIAAEGTVFATLQVFGVVLVVAILTHWVWITIQYVAAGSYIGRNPFALLKTMLPAYFTGLGTMSSAATIPVTLRQAKQNGIKEDIANFSIPLCATIHLSGSTITIVSCSLAVMMVMEGLATPTYFTMLPVIAMLGVIMIAAPGVPGGAVMAATGVLASMLGFSEAAIGLMIALYMAQDSFGTATNVTGDGAIALFIDKISNKG
ncbi:dicarboxylate/amino acid:cation symporter [Halalkalibacterium halodurans]|jgi:Na+/H+-dicarboxylate symporter|uniref:Sodium:glutamate symporter n=1 Tax=Halalkalibacterium halodurans TaxID=86665 RepID=A0A0M0KGX7_ALKHA|nr:dicarboxylate/amino acid:cation symporter [Halalkalibacterium halodurans]MDY7223761.1 dicarboxylate/amino acid:cation symporter [Halalkalibacterium halodurans]MDY7242982.1 dicarboxylate/amino acid:cation symporter [Halalkalibacterium halodurans]MED3645939.1 dicarboxylate/amino acid:cation symporter [Halalkalibacterium halodurans]MED4081166.1 dicarboxylate/amino acid:cation symporter [Halalkalibacterium halodurans]MED4084409.1 dicarboxylate/amino acid:cation symporter [Halalkalibacterium hal